MHTSRFKRKSTLESSKHTKMRSIVHCWPISATGEGLTPPTEPGSAPSPQGSVYLPNIKPFSWPKQTTETFFQVAAPCPVLTSPLNALLPTKSTYSLLLTQPFLGNTSSLLGLMMEKDWWPLGPLRDISSVTFSVWKLAYPAVDSVREQTGLEVPVSTQTTSYGHLPTPSAWGHAEQPSRQLKLYLSLFSWGCGLWPRSQRAFSPSLLLAHAWLHAKFWQDNLGSILPRAAAGCRGVLAPPIDFYYCFVPVDSIVHPLPFILWKVTRSKIQIFSSVLPAFFPLRYVVSEHSPSFSPWVLVLSAFIFVRCCHRVDIITHLSLWTPSWVPLDCSQYSRGCLLRGRLPAPWVIPPQLCPQALAVCLVTSVSQVCPVLSASTWC